MIIIFGSVGSGKSEQTTRLSNDLNCPRVSTSSLLKQHETPEIRDKMLSGSLVDDSIVISLLEEEFARLSVDKNEIIMDGSPRSVYQAQWFLEQIKSNKIMLTAIIKLNVSKEAVLERLIKRGREDDKREVITKRLSDYEAITNPVVHFLRANGIEVDEVNGELSLDEVHAEIKKVLLSKNES